MIRQAIAATAEYKLRRGDGGGARLLWWCGLLDGAESVFAEELEQNLYYVLFSLSLIFGPLICFPIFGLFHIGFVEF